MRRQVVRGAVDHFQAGLIADDHPLQAAPATAASTSSSASTASCSASTPAVCICPPLQCTSSGHISDVPATAATASATAVAANPRPQNWPSFSGSHISGLNTSGLSSILDQAVGQAVAPPSQGTSSQLNTPETARSDTSDMLARASQVLDQDP